MNKQNKLHGAIWFPVIIFFCSISSLQAQVRWNGGGGDNEWANAANWVGNQVPGATDNVLLDNSILGTSYTVTLPAGTATVQVKTITITPGAGKSIELMLPPTSKAATALQVTGPGYGLILNNGAIFRNASGAGNGTVPVAVADSIQINNGGRYIHNTDRSHADNVSVLSRAPGTEEGIFEFDAPVASSTISLSGRVFGKLVLSATTAAGGIANYTGSGVNPIRVRSDLQINAGATLSLNFSDTLFVNRHLIQHGGVLNLGNNTRSLVTCVKGNMMQDAGTIRKTGPGAHPTLLLAGNAPQSIACWGTITDSVALAVNNAAGVTLQAPLLLPYKLRLLNGKIITSTTQLLTLSAACTIEADSLFSNAFIDGPVRKEGLVQEAHFLLPVGKDITRWAALKNATGNFTVEFVKANPQVMSTVYGTGLHHISALEYWNIQADATPAPVANVELSFNDPNSVGVPDLNVLRVAQLDGTQWQDAGNTAFTGSAGTHGSVVSNVMYSFGPLQQAFALGSSVPVGASLPLREPVPYSRRSATAAPALVLVAVTSSTGGQAWLTIQAAEKGSALVWMRDMNGRCMQLMKVSLQKGVNTLPVNLSTYAAGIYTIGAVHAKGPSNTLRLVKW